MLELEHRPGSSWPIEVRARAIALFAEGYGLNRVQAAIADEMGSGPNLSTLGEWRKEAQLSGTIRMLQEELAIRYSRLLHRAADHYDGQPNSELAKANVILALNSVAGTNEDKLQRDPAHQAQQGATYNIVIVDKRSLTVQTDAASTPIIEGTAQEPPAIETTSRPV